MTGTTTKTAMTEYALEYRGKIKVTVQGRDTDQNFEKAKREAARMIRDGYIDGDDLECISSKEFTDYEN